MILFQISLSDIRGTGDDVEKSDSDESVGTQFDESLPVDKKKRKLNSKKSLLFGSGVTDDSFINKIVDLVAEKMKPSDQKIGRGSDLSPPTAELVPNSEDAPLPFNNTIKKNDDNDTFGKN